jgi:hypothetical protein
VITAKEGSKRYLSDPGITPPRNAYGANGYKLYPTLSAKPAGATLG